ncbi:MAG: hypothetical protein SRB1_02497 [Desulfobacteraceae bacterium Eth-SRB1]|nr:MAG: hypothetical protein SRB1_02497 [Desulfobacteraceae bacterium Eth-SRB1]
MGKEKTGSQIDIEWKNRVLCSDEGCIGVIGPDGRCNECGKIYEGHENSSDNESRQATAESRPEPETEPDSREAIEEKEETIQTDIYSEWKNRVLCSDEGCIGVIGPDGRCKECGKIYESK